MNEWIEIALVSYGSVTVFVIWAELYLLRHDAETRAIALQLNPWRLLADVLSVGVAWLPLVLRYAWRQRRRSRRRL